MLVGAAAGLQVGPLAGAQQGAAVCLLGEGPFGGATVPVHGPPLPLADVAVEDVLDVLHNEVDRNCGGRGNRGVSGECPDQTRQNTLCIMRKA